MASTAARGRPGVLAHPAGQVGDHHQGQRPAARHVVRRRGQVEQHTGDEAQHHGELGAPGQAAATTTSRTRLGTTPSRRGAGRATTCRTRATDDRGEAHQGACQAHRDASVGLDQGPVAGGVARTTTPTTSRAEKSTNGSITARWDCSRTLAKTSADPTDRDARDVGARRPSLPQVTTTCRPGRGPRSRRRSSRSSRPSCAEVAAAPAGSRPPCSCPSRPPTTDSASTISSTVAVGRQ